jgi:ElaB/YqjD/DUF883 family membrane-anchored ribosome-binding protein
MADTHNKQNQGTSNQGGSQQRGGSGQSSANMADKARDTASSGADKARDTATNAADKARDTATSVADKARDLAQGARDAASGAVERARDMASSAAESATHSMGGGASTLAGTIRHSLPSEGMIGTAASTVADTLERGGQYLSEGNLRSMSNDLSNVIRQNPIPSVLVGVGVGFVLAHLLSPRS